MKKLDLRILRFENQVIIFCHIQLQLCKLDILERQRKQTSWRKLIKRRYKQWCERMRKSNHQLRNVSHNASTLSVRSLIYDRYPAGRGLASVYFRLSAQGILQSILSRSLSFSSYISMIHVRSTRIL